MRKTRFDVLLAAAALTLCSCASTEARLKEQRTATMLERERLWITAMCDHDEATLQQLLADEFVLTFTDMSGAPGAVPRAQWFDNLRHMTFGAVRIDAPSVTMHGDAVATVRMRMHLQEWKVQDHALPPLYDLLDVWVRRAGRWQVVMRISEMVEPVTAPQ